MSYKNDNLIFTLLLVNNFHCEMSFYWITKLLVHIDYYRSGATYETQRQQWHQIEEHAQSLGFNLKIDNDKERYNKWIGEHLEEMVKVVDSWKLKG